MKSAAVWSALAATAIAVAPLVDLGYAKYNGVNTGATTQWLGIRYAAPPLGNLRFQKPADPVQTHEVQQADKHGKICLGTDQAPTSATFAKHSEDCLFLDVYAPSHASSSSKLPVFVFIQGGGFNSNSNANYNGTGLIHAANHGIVVVNFNYRVGVFGFLTDGNGATPNNGLWDQVKVLEWVRAHVAQFGGDPAHVVIGGDSAGAASVAYHLTRGGGGGGSSTEQALFVGAAAESVSFSTVLDVDSSQYLYDNYTARVGCAASAKGSLACLRSKTSAELQAGNVNAVPLPGAQHPQLFMWNPVIDGDFITELPYDAFRRGHFVKVPVIIGDDTNGGTVFTPRSTTTVAEMHTFLHDQFPALTTDDLATIDELHPNPQEAACPAKGCRWRQVSDAYGQMRYMCPGLTISDMYAAHGVSASWAYRWNVEDPAQMADGIGVPHTVEVHAIFGPTNTAGAPKSYYAGEKNAHAVTVAQAYWVSFIQTLNPNTHRAKGAIEWEAWGLKKRRIVVNTGGKTVMEGLDAALKKSCDFMVRIGPRIRQ
ncbi:hypothetical protein PWT90_08774 [Aphanocladium album]|nr:hypothetical protein PWT90_08774 [Aphanocladium album]